ncbi:acyl-CoA dehydrogenase family protein [Psychrobacillus sp. BM2]|uniref:acyl-CoA dehydrogenase family protein n=1 Tax=Psychrobacillus sp. BM2 TaxID=3400421 RepID=UPI003B018793
MSVNTISTVDSAIAYESLMKKAKELVPKLRERSQELQQTRRIPQETIDELEAAGLFHLTIPKEYGGQQLDFRHYVDVIAEIGRGCGSTSWVLTLTNVCNWFTSVLFTEEVHRVLFESEKKARVCGVLDPRKASVKRVDGGYLIEDALWGFASGSWHADYFFLGIPLVDEKGEIIDPAGVALIPKSEVQIKDDWFTVSMRGTGSNTVTVQNVFVPDERISSLGKGIEGIYKSEHLSDQSLYRSAFIPVSAIIMTGPALGLAKAAMEHFMEKLPNRRITYTPYEKQAEAPITHLQVAEASMKIDTALLHAYRAAEDIDNWAKSGEYMELENRARVRMDCALVVRTCQEAIEILMTAGGGSAVSENNPLNLIASDIRASNVHAVMTPTTNLELYGRILCGQGPNVPLV